MKPYEETEIWLGEEKIEDNYINASRIQSPYNEGNNGNLIIATQGPLNTTV